MLLSRLAWRLDAALAPAETALFLALAVCLPLFESPKTIALAGFIGVVLIREVRQKPARFALAPVEVAMLAVMATAALAGGATLLRDGGEPAARLLHGTGEVLLLGLTFLAVYRSGLALTWRRAWLWAALGATGLGIGHVAEGQLAVSASARRPLKSSARVEKQ